MLTSRRVLSLGAIFLFAAFCFGLVRLLMLRYSAGDVFPPYSSLRADALGTKIFYESLRALPDRVVQRNEQPADRLGDGEGTTLLVLGVDDFFMSEKERVWLERFLQTGGRLVITYFPRYGRPPSTKLDAAPKPNPSPTAEPEPTPKGISLSKLLERWLLKTETDRNDEDNLGTRVADLPLEENLSWHSGISFHAAQEWETIFECERGPVVVERFFGAGSVVLAADSYFLSNEALLAERRPALLAWIAGPGRRVIFDETHLNINEQPGVATLLRRYGLGGFVVGFLILVALWLWKNATETLSARGATDRVDEVVSGRDSFSGFVHLLRRGIAPNQLLAVCVEEWKKSAVALGGLKPGEETLIRAATEDGKNPVVAYNKISEMLNAKKWKTTN